MRKFKFTGRVKITYEWEVNETIEVEDEDGEADAVDQLCDDLDPSSATDHDWDLFSLDVEELDESGADLAERRARNLALLAAWNSGVAIAE